MHVPASPTASQQGRGGEPDTWGQSFLWEQGGVGGEACTSHSEAQAEEGIGCYLVDAPPQHV